METKSFGKDNWWNWACARHLLNRSGFGGKPSEIKAFRESRLGASIEMLFNFNRPALERPAWLDDYDKFSLLRFRRMLPEERQEVIRTGRQRIHEFQIGWIQRMIESQTPADMLWEKMTFFWHGHFATSVQKVKLPPLLFKQLSLFHEHAVGNFRELLHGISRDPAMLRYLDNNQNRKGKPNENFARELMELFSLGPGNYTESDVKEAARAFTGWTNDPFNFRVRRRHHDFGKKTFLGRTGNFDGEDIVNIILEQPVCAEFITRKILDFFFFENATEELIQSFAGDFRNNDYDIQSLLKRIFSHKEFYSADVIGQQIKSPIQLVVGTARTLGVDIENLEFYLYALNMMGQVPYFPPNVKGWPGGQAWIDTSRLLTRYTFAEIVSQGEIPREVDPRSQRDPERRNNKNLGKGKGAFGRMMRRHHLRIEFDPDKLLDGETTPSDILKRLEAVLLSQKLTEGEHLTLLESFESSLGKMSRKAALKALLGDMMTLPVYQLG
jgi:hypothetical protein